MPRLVLRLSGLVAGLLVCLALHGLWRLLRCPSPWPRHFLACAGWCVGLRVRSSGRPLHAHILFVANHVSWLDILALGGTTGTAFVSRDDVAHWPIVGWLAGLNATLYVARHDRRAARRQATELRAALAGPQPVALFPEGTTEGGHEVLPFRASLFGALFPPLPAVRVQPVAIDYGPLGPDIAWVGEEPAGANAKRILMRRGTIPVTLHFLPPVDPRQAGDRKTLSEQSRAEIVAALGAQSPSPASDSAPDRL